MKHHNFLCAAALFTCLGASAQTPPASAPMDYPPEVQAIPAQALTELLGGQVWTARLANGTTWRMDYNRSGYMFTDVSTGGRDTAKWRTEDGRVCHEFRGSFPSGCNEYKLAGNKLYLKRGNGEIVPLEKR